MFSNFHARIAGSADSSDPEGSRNFLLHVAMLSASKIGDRLVDPKLVLSWLMGALSAPVWMIGMLVPIREAGALLPQVFLAGRVAQTKVRKWWWVAGAVGQGASVFGIALVAWSTQESFAAWAILALLACFALSRSICSVSYKDVLGKTVPTGARGTATGSASSTAALGALAFGLLLAVGVLAKTVPVICGVLVVAAILWALASFLCTRLVEPESDIGGERESILSQFGYLREDPQLSRFILVRGLLTVTALAPPYLVAMSGTGGFSFDALGPFVSASAVAALTSGFVWGRFSDRSSRLVLQTAALASAAILAGTVLLSALGMASVWVLAGMLYLLMVAYEGIRTGRSTHLVDMAPESRRAAYTAVSNTLIGVILLAGGAFGFVADMFGQGATLAVFAVFCAVAAWLAQGLKHVQKA